MTAVFFLIQDRKKSNELNFEWGKRDLSSLICCLNESQQREVKQLGGSRDVS